MDIRPTITGKWAVKVALKGCFVKQRGGETDSGRLILRVKSDENKVPDELTATQPGFHSPYFKCNFPAFHFCTTVRRVTEDNGPRFYEC